MPEIKEISSQPNRGSFRLKEEASRLMEFKRENVRNDETPCPQCATPVNIRAAKCPHCTSDISQHTNKVRTELARLKEVTAELDDLHHQELELLKHEAGQKPIWKRIESFLSEPKFVQDLKLVLPFLIGFFGLAIYASTVLSGFLFLLTALAGGFVVLLLFKKWGLKKYVTVDFYRGILIAGLFVLITNTTFNTATFWPTVSVINQTVVVNSEKANIRELPDTSSPIVAESSRGNVLVVVERKDSWYKVKTPSGAVGWVHSSLLRTT